MYKHIMVPTDGSRVSEDAAAAGIELARVLGARVTVLHVLPSFPDSGLDAWAHPAPDYPDRIERSLQRRAVEYLDSVRDAALRSGVQCDCRVTRAGCVHREILQEAQDRGCDLIVMGSHLHGGGPSLAHSETVQVAIEGRIPVLVHQGARARR